MSDNICVLMTRGLAAAIWCEPITSSRGRRHTTAPQLQVATKLRETQNLEKCHVMFKRQVILGVFNRLLKV